MHMLVLMVALMAAGPVFAQPVKMVVLGDSLSAGLGLSGPAAFPARLKKALKDKGIEVDMINAGVSGDTASGGRDRLDWSVPAGTEAVIVELGANDALRGTDPAKKFDVPLYPFFLAGVAADPKLNQADGIHPTAEGVDIIVANILPTVQAFLGTIRGQRS